MMKFEVRSLIFESVLQNDRGASRNRCACSVPTVSLRSTFKDHPSNLTRRGISLIEILISMFVLLFGLMGVAAIFPVGSHYMTQGETFEATSLAAANAFEEMQTRNMLNPEFWYYGDSLTNNMVPVIDPNTGEFFNAFPGGVGPGHAFVIDPTGSIETNVAQFPFDVKSTFNPWAVPPYSLTGTAWPVRRITLRQFGVNAVPLTKSAAETIFQMHDDLSISLPDQQDKPSQQVWSTDNSGAALARQYKGDFSWLATIVPRGEEALQNLQPSSRSYGNHIYDVSVVTFRKRDLSLSSERMLEAEMYLGGELVMYDSKNAFDVVDQAVEGIRPNNWVAVMGVHPITGQFLMHWYRVLSLDDETSTDYVSTIDGATGLRRAMLRGPDWPILAANGPGNRDVAWNLRVLLMPRVVNVVTRPMKLGN